MARMKSQRVMTLLCVAGLCTAWGSGIALALPGSLAQDHEQRFEISSRPLAEALTVFAAQTGLQMLYDAPLAAGRHSAAVSGTMSPRSGLAVMLQGTGLSARFTRAGAVVIYATSTSTVTLNPLTAVAAPVVGRSRTNPVFLAYADTVRRRITDHVRTDDLLTRARYGLSLRLWVAEDGQSINAEILVGSGQPSLDERFMARVRATPMPPPPPGLPQPMRIEFSVGARR